MGRSRWRLCPPADCETRQHPVRPPWKDRIGDGRIEGLGLQIAESLGELGAHVVLAARKTEELKSAETHLRQRRIEVDWVAADVGKEEDITRLVEHVVVNHGAIDVLINNAGVSWGAPAEEHSP